MSEDSLRQFFEAIWKDTEGLVHISSKGKNGEKDWKPGYFYWPDHKNDLVAYCLATSSEREVYFQPVLYRRPDKKPKSFSDLQIALERKNVLGSWVLWADFDGTAPADWAKLASTGIPEPSIKVRTSGQGNQHAYWQLSEFQSDPTIIEDKNRAIAHIANADTSCWDITRFLRPPYTTNHGYGSGKEHRGGQKYDVIIEQQTDVSYSAEFVKRERDFRPLVSDSLAQHEIPSIRKVLAQRAWSDDFIELFEKQATELGTPDQKADRSRALARLAFLGAEQSFTDAEIYAVLDDADTRWKKYIGRSDRHKRIIDFVERARRKYPVGLEEAGAGLFAETSIDAAPKLIYTFKELISAEINLVWALKDVLAIPGLGLIYGAPGSGKTLLMIRMMIAFALGRNWMKWENPNGPKRVLFFSLELNLAKIQYQVRKMVDSLTAEEQDTLDEFYSTAPVATMVALDLPEGRQKLEFYLNKFKPEILFIDSLSVAISATVNDDTAVRMFNEYMMYIGKQYNCSIIVIHHNRKAGADAKNKEDDNDSGDDIYGSRYIPARADFMFKLTRTPEDDRLKMLIPRLQVTARQRPFYIDCDWANIDFAYGGLCEEYNPDEQAQRKLKRIGGHLSSVFIKPDKTNEPGQGLYEE